MLIRTTNKGGWNHSLGAKNIIYLKIKLIRKLKVLNCDINGNQEIVIRSVHE
jgi:hypothetical protein